MHNLTLYDISQDYLQALDVFTDPEADIPLEAAMDTLEGLEGQLQEAGTALSEKRYDDALAVADDINSTPVRLNFSFLLNNPNK